LAKRSAKTQTTQNESQITAFRKAARALGRDESEERFQEALRTVAKAKPRPQVKKKRNRSVAPEL
jgi:hypothetical protein